MRGAISHMGMGLGMGLIPMLQSPSSLASLFSAGEQGVWYDPSDFATMFQDGAGVTQVTAPGQTVGLILDKSKGLAVGSNTIPALDFTNATAWPASAGGTLTRDSASAFTTTASGGLRNSAAVTVGLWYRITFNYTCTTGLGVRNAGSNANTVGTDVAAGSGVFTALFAAVDTNIYFRIAGAGSVTITNLVVTSLAGNHAYQPGGSSLRPLFQTDGSAHYFLQFDGTDDFLQTAAINFSATDKMTVAVGVRKNVDTSYQAIVELGVNPTSINGAFGVGASTATSDASRRTWASILSGSTLNNLAGASIFAAPITSVLDLQLDLAQSAAASEQVLAVNGAVQTQTYGLPDAGSGNFSNNPIYIGRRGGTVQALNGRIYGLVVRGAATSAAELTQLRNWINSKTGAY